MLLNHYNGLELICLRDNGEFKEKAAQWFSGKWGIPICEYEASIGECLAGKNSIPQWYVIINDTGKIIAGAGLIENDFHNRKDLSHNLCALYVEEEYRKRGLGKYILDFIREDMADMGIERLYLVTDHTEFYEKCGWDFLTMVRDEGGEEERMYTAYTMKK